MAFRQTLLQGSKERFRHTEPAGADADAQVRGVEPVVIAAAGESEPVRGGQLGDELRLVRAE